jgi:pyruvate dehydrogenase E2 component (dihydrolipoamide acetyltransferase)
MGDFCMPSLGADMDTGTITEWRVAPGDRVQRGDIVAVVETEKSTIEVEVFEDGIVAELLEPEGVEVAVGTPLARIEPRESTASPAATATPPRVPRVTSPLVRHLATDLGVDLTSLRPTGPGGVVTRSDVEHAAHGAAERAARAAPNRSPSSMEATDVDVGGRRRASPLARRRAADEGIDLTSRRGSGPGGAVVAADLDDASAAAPIAAPVSSPGSPRTSSLRESVGALMARSKREIPHYYVTTTIDLGPATAWLRDANAPRPVGERILPAALLLKAVVRAASEVPVMNGHWIDGAFLPKDGVDLGVAISLRSGGLVAPAIVDADRRSLDELMAALRELVSRARAGVLRASEMVLPSITVTNLGDQGVESVLPVIYPPQVAMVGFGKILERPWAIDGMLTVRPVVTASVAADHRANDGHDGARFLATVDRVLQQPADL